MRGASRPGSNAASSRSRCPRRRRPRRPPSARPAGPQRGGGEGVGPRAAAAPAVLVRRARRVEDNDGVDGLAALIRVVFAHGVGAGVAWVLRGGGGARWKG